MTWNMECIPRTYPYTEIDNTDFPQSYEIHSWLRFRRVKLAQL